MATLIDEQTLQSETGVVPTEGGPVPYVDLRHRDAGDGLSQLIANWVNGRLKDRLGPVGMRLVVLARPQASDAARLMLAREGIHLIVGSGESPREELLGHFVRQVYLRSRSRARMASQPPAAGTAVRPESSNSEAVFSQSPPWFDSKAYEERMRLLGQPWQDKDRWTSES